MKNALSPSVRPVLEQLAWSNVLVAFDYDGTLAPIVSRPEKAVMRESTRRLLTALVGLYPCAVISGRAQRDAMRRLHGVRVHQIIGNHGIEPWRATPRLAGAVARWRPVLEERVAGLPGVRIEDKVFSLAVHYRQSRQKKLARKRILEAAEALGDARVVGGKQVVNILPGVSANKGLALERTRARLGCDTALYVGDDETDEDVFALDQPGQLLGIRVGRSRTSAAPYYIESQRHVDAFLELLVGLRIEAGISRPPWGAR